MEIDWDNPNLLIGDNYSGKKHHLPEVQQQSFNNTDTTDNELTHPSFMQWLYYFENLPDFTLKHYRVKPTVLEAVELLNDRKDFYQGVAAWLFDQLYNFDSDPASKLTDTHWQYYEPFALVSKAKLLLCRETLRWYRNNRNGLSWWSPLELFESAGQFWFFCEGADFLYFLYETNLGKCLKIPDLIGTPVIKGKVKLHKDYLAEAGLREDPTVITETMLFSELEVPCFTTVLITEARKIAPKDSQVEALLHHYWSATTHLFSHVRRNDQYQATQLIENGLAWEKWIGGQGRKPPKPKGFNPKKKNR